MSLTTILLFIPASFALNMAPGPNNLLSMANAKRYGVKVACCAGIGRLVAFVGMITLAATGLATVLHTSEKLFLAIKVVGGLYLLWLAFQLWTADPTDGGEDSSAGKGLLQLARQEFLLAAGNPKAILIFTAFLPQFVDPSGSIGLQFLILGALFLMLEWIAIGTYAVFGKVLRHWFSRPAMRQLFNRICAGFLGSAGVGLLLTRRE
ncbi:LysE family translocator [Chromohalobacter israelensis]|uniref:LysE family translocator n=1 Tax=Chromohalobacter israelensis TaxID=141390 RepID=UPI0015C4562A|nr:LysE family translocator [Chromohalobacter salexigens]NWO56434.1 lysine transporter LysE [Chromohalobacter salexigens]